jgi:DNA-binding beta-propeller fold protein YncE
MRIPTPLYALGAAAAMTFLAGCSGGTSSVAPVGGASNLSHARVLNVAHVPSLGAPSFQNLVHPSQPGSMHSFMSPDAAGITPTLYVSQFYTNDIQVYKQGGTNQSPIGTITNGVINPQGMFVTPNNWIYVANTGGNNVLVFDKGGTTAIQTLNDPNQYPVDVAVDTDGTVYASNIFATDGSPGSVTVWAPGNTNPTGSLAVPNNAKVLFCALDKFHNLYVNYIDINSGVGAMVKFKHGQGNAQLTNVVTNFPGGMEFDQLGRLAAADQIAANVSAYRLPSGTPVFTVASTGDSLGVSFSKTRSYLYVSDAVNGNVYKYVWKNGSLVDTISTGLGSSSPPFGVAADPGAPL